MPHFVGIVASGGEIVLRRECGSHCTFCIVMWGIVIAGVMPLAFLWFYQRRFDYDPIIVIFGETAVLFCMAVIGLIAAGLAWRFPPATSKVSVWFLGGATGVFLMALLLIYIGAAGSNAIWGDTLTYKIVASYTTQTDTVLAFLPVSDAWKKVILIAVIALALFIFAAMLWLALRLARDVVSVLTSWIGAAPGKALARRQRLTLSLAGAFIVTAGTCSAFVITRPHALRGEPLTNFLKFIPVAMDDVRLSVALEDNATRKAYLAPKTFDRKNVVLIFSDSLRADHMGLYGYNRPTTPFLSSLAEKGVLHRVDMALSSCSETYCGIATTFASRPYHQVSPHNFRLHSLLHDAGYRVRFYLSGDHRSWNYLFDFYGTDYDEIHDFKTMSTDSMQDDRNIIAGLENLEPYCGKPNFFYLFMTSTHLSGHRLPEYQVYQPIHADAGRLNSFWNEIGGTTRVGKRDVQAAGALPAPEVEAIRNRYDNGIIQADALIQRIFKTLEDKGYLQNSIVAILSDHGDGLGEHGHIGHTRYLFQEDIRIPLLIYDADKTRYQNSTYATQIDIAPTIVDRLGLPIPTGWQGQSLLRPAADRITLHQTRRGRSPCFAAVEAKSAALTKYIRCGEWAGDAREVLFDLVKDPGESENLLARASPETVARLRTAIDERSRSHVNRCRTFECRD